MDGDTIIELHNFHGYYEQRWEIIHVWNRYYKIISTYSDKALTAPTGANNDVVTQSSYTGELTQRWRFIEQSDGTYKISPESNSNYYMAAGNISSSADQDLEIRTAQSDGGDRWELKKTYVSVEFYYDWGFIEKRRNGTDSDSDTQVALESFISGQCFPRVETIFGSFFGIDLDFSSIDYYESDAYNCLGTNINRCNCFGDSSCLLEWHEDPYLNNNAVGFLSGAHCTSLIRLRNNMIVGIPENTMRIALTGYNICVRDGTTHNPYVEGLAHYNYPIISIKQPTTKTDKRLVRLIAHEISHLYGVQDHSTGVVCVMDKTGARDIDCMITTDIWCEDCENTILSNIGKYLG